MTQSPNTPRPYTVHVHEANGVAEQLLPGYSPRAPRQYSIEADVAQAVAAQTLDSDRTTRSLLPEVRIPAENFVQEAILSAATDAHDDVYHYVYNRLRDHTKVRKVAEHVDRYRSQGPRSDASQHPVAHGLAVQALGSAGSTSNLPADIRPQMEDYVRSAVDDGTQRAHQVVLAWWSGKSEHEVAGVDEFNARVEAYRLREVLSHQPPARLATHHPSGPAPGIPTTAASRNIKKPSEPHLG